MRRFFGFAHPSSSMDLTPFFQTDCCLSVGTVQAYYSSPLHTIPQIKEDDSIVVQIMTPRRNAPVLLVAGVFVLLLLLLTFLRFPRHDCHPRDDIGTNDPSNLFHSELELSQGSLRNADSMAFSKRRALRTISSTLVFGSERITAFPDFVCTSSSLLSIDGTRDASSLKWGIYTVTTIPTCTITAIRILAF